MAALPQTNISTSIVRSKLEEISNQIFDLCSSNKLNKWSRKKPITGTFPAGVSGKYGIDPTSNWSYTPITANARLGDFRGYEHDKDIAGPILYIDSADGHIPTQISPTLTPYSLGQIGEFIFKSNQAHEDVRILPSEVGISNYYIGIKLTQGANNWYKTPGAKVSDITTGQEVHFDACLTSFSPVTFTDFPNNTLGNWSYYLFISTTSTSNTWSASAPTGYLELPGSTGTVEGSKTILSRGAFELRPYLVLTTDALGTIPVTELRWEYGESQPLFAQSVYIWTNEVSTKGPGIPQESRFSPAFAYIGPLTGHWDFTGFNESGSPLGDDEWYNGCRVDIWPVDDNGSTQIDDTCEFGLDTVDYANDWLASIYTFSLLHEDGSPPSVVWREEESWSLTVNTVNSGLEIGSSSLNLTIDTDLTVATDTALSIFRDTDETIQVFSGTIHLASDGSMSPNPDTFALSEQIQPGDIVVIRVGNAL